MQSLFSTERVSHRFDAIKYVGIYMAPKLPKFRYMAFEITEKQRKAPKYREVSQDSWDLKSGKIYILGAFEDQLHWVHASLTPLHENLTGLYSCEPAR